MRKKEIIMNCPDFLSGVDLDKLIIELMCDIRDALEAQRLQAAEITKSALAGLKLKSPG